METFISLQPKENLTNQITVRLTKSDYKKLISICKTKKIKVPDVAGHLIKDFINSLIQQ